METEEIYNDIDRHVTDGFGQKTDQLERLTNAAGNIQNDGVMLQIAAKLGDSVDELRRLFDVVKDSWECLAEVWREIDGTPDLDQPLTQDWLREHVPGHWQCRVPGTLECLMDRCTTVRWSSCSLNDTWPQATLRASVRDVEMRIRTHRRNRTIAEAIKFLQMANVPLKGVK